MVIIVVPVYIRLIPEKIICNFSNIVHRWEVHRQIWPLQEMHLVSKSKLERPSSLKEYDQRNFSLIMTSYDLDLLHVRMWLLTASVSVSVWVWVIWRITNWRHLEGWRFLIRQHFWVCPSMPIRNSATKFGVIFFLATDYVWMISWKHEGDFLFRSVDLPTLNIIISLCMDYLQFQLIYL